MICPKCEKEMVVMHRPLAIIFQDGSQHIEVLGRCEDCDFDAFWEIVTDVDGNTEEINFRRYFFG